MNKIQVLKAEQGLSFLSPSFQTLIGAVPKYFLHRSKLPHATEKRRASILYFYSRIRHVNEQSGSQNFTASLLPNRMRSSHFVFANVHAISITLTSFPSHDFSKLKHFVELLILGKRTQPTPNKPPKNNPTMDVSALFCLVKSTTGRT